MTRKWPIWGRQPSHWGRLKRLWVMRNGVWQPITKIWVRFGGNWRILEMIDTDQADRIDASTNYLDFVMPDKGKGSIYDGIKDPGVIKPNLPNQPIIAPAGLSCDVSPLLLALNGVTGYMSRALSDDAAHQLPQSGTPQPPATQTGFGEWFGDVSRGRPVTGGLHPPKPVPPAPPEGNAPGG